MMREMMEEMQKMCKNMGIGDFRLSRNYR